MLDRRLNIKDKLLNKNIDTTRKLEIGSGIAVILGAVFINFLSDDISSTDYTEDYEPIVDDTNVDISKEDKESNDS